MVEATLFANSKERMSAVTSKVRLYDLAKDLKIDTKRLIEEVRREGVDVSVPSRRTSRAAMDRCPRSLKMPSSCLVYPNGCTISRGRYPAASSNVSPSHEQS